MRDYSLWESSQHATEFYLTPFHNQQKAVDLKIEKLERGSQVSFIHHD